MAKGGKNMTIAQKKTLEKSGMTRDEISNYLLSKINVLKGMPSPHGKGDVIAEQYILIHRTTGKHKEVTIYK